ncbi:glycosyltransferase family 2 protein [Williamsia maris]|uniref:4,4'-diaponeurosporenoate glycosyltransferase n=2 Tax=Williamsia maris TaxID=72806 RepID=A0ABT1HIR8_9NOCA|nr:Glycosyl transferase family 2 [Williamsia maris]
MKTITSTRDQDYPYVEHIVIDGGSGADTEQVLGQSGVAYWQSQPDGGRYDGMNQGIQHASGDLLWFMHSSDVFAGPSAITVAVDALSRRPDPRRAWGFGGARLIGGDRDGTVWSYEGFSQRRLALGIAPIPHQAAVFGADLVDEIGGYSTSFGLAADHLFMLCASRLAEPVVVSEVLCDFDTTGAGSVRPQRDHFRDVRDAWPAAGVFPCAGRVASTAIARAVQGEAWAKSLVRRGIGLSR